MVNIYYYHHSLTTSFICLSEKVLNVSLVFRVILEHSIPVSTVLCVTQSSNKRLLLKNFLSNYLMRLMSVTYLKTLVPCLALSPKESLQWFCPSAVPQ